MFTFVMFLFVFSIQLDHLTVEGLLAWPLGESEAGVVVILIETFLLFLYYYDAFLMLISRNLQKAERFLSKQGQFQPHFYSKARQQGTQL